MSENLVIKDSNLVNSSDCPEVFRSLALDWDIASPAISQAYRVSVLRKKKRILSGKRRSEISCSTKKMYKQKGTGRARHGDKSAPQFRGGARYGPSVALEPYVSYTSKRFKASCLSSLILHMISCKRVFQLGDIFSKISSTKEAMSSLSAVKDKKVLLACSADEIQSMGRFFANIHFVSIQDVRYLSLHDCLVNEIILFSSEGLSCFFNIFSQKGDNK